ncbi:MAG: 50S ribosomal protein L23 [Parcubacteria group bacterium CG_4_9_14_0_2_um_filter_41_8]|nr:MAG: 50S ribosomal protein L23 [Parcubacteria group bacterium CG1_02_41_12]PIP67428.1 MAG: 50S ribosomal protein L23 [Parcubacteria group bacterium CG22_combo_CG10-13_8_21_14_all_41_9]PIQ79371.1 MAG: 50S ribosomal protein L23 [Parcubacteria group bacterium CG11_big_fil_rev_8_21_14_0_20_41_14]PIR56711.1 MAG: 50S ribosomal protein L23 [Parcubacteria group bacterium CG10_big_fil_rev_8_21_14_0_10_41_35]PJC40447.1 MAG: 50S ribosomal protein L23 [Parcubacteria group bacterium CG_4_9_14_0_2_um_filt
MFKFWKKNQFGKDKENIQRKSADKESSKKDGDSIVLNTGLQNDAKKKTVKDSGSKKDSIKKDEKNREAGTSKDTKLEAGHRIILKPHATEKTAKTGTHDTYAFIVGKSANKIEIKKAFWRMYNIKPVSIQIVNMPAKATSFKNQLGMKSAWKKAYIRIPKGSNISVYEGV